MQPPQLPGVAGSNSFFVLVAVLTSSCASAPDSGSGRGEDRLTQQRQIFATGHPKPREVETIRLQ